MSAVATAGTTPCPCWWPADGRRPDTPVQGVRSPRTLAWPQVQPVRMGRTPAVRTAVIPEAADGQSVARWPYLRPLLRVMRTSPPTTWSSRCWCATPPRAMRTRPRSASTWRSCSQGCDPLPGEMRSCHLLAELQVFDGSAGRGRAVAGVSGSFARRLCHRSISAAMGSMSPAHRTVSLPGSRTRRACGIFSAR